MAAQRYKITTTSGLVVYWVKRACVHTLSRELADICVHRAKSNTDSGASRTPIPTQAEHRFRAARTP